MIWYDWISSLSRSACVSEREREKDFQQRDRSEYVDRLLQVYSDSVSNPILWWERERERERSYERKNVKKKRSNRQRHFQRERGSERDTHQINDA